MNLHNAEFIKSVVSPRDFMRDGRPQVVFAGKSNVGKSSVINKILNRKNFARVGASPGKTVHINYFLIDNYAYFVDLPGYGYAKVSKSEKQRWAGLVEGYLADDRTLALVFQLVDFRHPPTADDIMMINFLIDNEIPFVVVLTKADKLTKNERAKRRKALLSEMPCAEDIHMIEFSAMNGEGVEEIREIIEDIEQEALEGNAPDEAGKEQ